VVEGLPASEIAAVLDANGGFGRDSCPLIELMLRTLHRAARVRSMDDALGELFLLLKRISTQGQTPIGVTYLVRSAKHWTIDRQRREGARPRCGVCQHYGWIAKSCLRQNNPYAGTIISPSVSPADLVPVCHEFRSRKEAVGADDDIARATSPADSGVERLVAGLERLQRTDPAAEALLVLVYFEGYSQRDLAHLIPCSRRRVTAELEAALKKLGLILEDLT
jgi:DNA-directed RNA polymerase specialized sigma24 family protein